MIFKCFLLVKYVKIAENSFKKTNFCGEIWAWAFGKRVVEKVMEFAMISFFNFSSISRLKLGFHYVWIWDYVW